jgi:hypothetical protein
MKIEILQGTEQRLYDLVVPLVMNPAVLRQNNNVAFKTTEDHTWIIAVDNEVCTGFLPIQWKKRFAEVNNYYIHKRSKTLLTKLLKQAEQQVKKTGYETLIVITQVEDSDVMTKMKYTVEKQFVKYTWFLKKV